jgi:phosphoserine phosphatase RsbX
MAPLMPVQEMCLAETGLRLVWACAQSGKYPDQPSGDGFRLCADAENCVFAVVDGSGSGAQAAEVAEACLAELRATPATEFEASFARCHRRLAQSRGAALGLVHLDRAQAALTWAAVGDVHGILLPDLMEQDAGRASMLQSPGTLGIHYRGILPQTLHLRPGHMIILSTDGIRRDYVARPRPMGPAGEVAERLLQDHAKAEDDSLVLVIEALASR